MTILLVLMDDLPDQLRLSVSKTKTFEQCPKQFKFSYILKMPRKQMDYHITGHFCHSALEDFHQAYINGSNAPLHQEMGKAFKDAKTEYAEKMTPEMIKECYEILGNYLKLISEGSQYNTIKNVLAVEKQFYLPIGNNVVLNGLIDKVQIDPDGVLHIADYKTTLKGAKYLKKDFFQLLTYAYTMLQEDPTLTKIRASYILLRHNCSFITTEFDIEQIMAVKDKYLAYAEAIMKETEYPAKTSALCNFCDFQSICEEGLAFSRPRTTHGQINW